MRVCSAVATFSSWCLRLLGPDTWGALQQDHFLQELVTRQCSQCQRMSVLVWPGSWTPFALTVAHVCRLCACTCASDHVPVCACIRPVARPSHKRGLGTGNQNVYLFPQSPVHAGESIGVPPNSQPTSNGRAQAYHPFCRNCCLDQCAPLLQDQRVQAPPPFARNCGRSPLRNGAPCAHEPLTCA